jgi:hypothetical protein
MIRQFCTMARSYGFASSTEFALVVEGWTQKQRTDCLERFYLKRKQRLAELEMAKLMTDTHFGHVLDRGVETDDIDEL